jgi:hypothetical protein
MRLRINRHFATQLANEYMPLMVKGAAARLQLFTAGTDEHLNMRIVKEVITGLHKKVQIKIIASNGDCCFFRLTDAETCTLYKYLLNHPIMESKTFELQQRDALVQMLHKYLSEPVPPKKIFQLYR